MLMSQPKNRSHARRRARPWSTILGALLLAAVAARASAAVPVPSVAGPIPVPDMLGAPTHNYPFFATNHHLAEQGYVENEYFFAGNATRYSITAPTAGTAGTTATVMDTGHPYVTRMVVRRPADPARFNGTVLVEWYNVTNGFDAENDWFFSWEHILKKGYAWVGVSAQNVGVTALKAWSSRYANLNVTVGGTITGDALAYDIFSQAGQAIRTPGAVNVLGGLVPQHIIAMGESQSAIYLVTYVNSINPLANVYDGFFLQSAIGGTVRSDLTVPVFKFSTEYDVYQGDGAVRQPDTSKFRTWEVAGTSHVDKHLRASREPLELRDNLTSSEAALNPTCQIPNIGSSAPDHYVVGTAYDALVNWIANGVAPPTSPRIQLSQTGAPGQTSTIARNYLGLALGGIQLPQVAVPTEQSVGINVGPGACVRWGFSLQLPKSELDELYPSYQSYVDEVAAAGLNDVGQGYIEQGDLEQTMLQAVTSDVGNPTTAQRQRNLAALFGQASAGLDYGLQ